MKGNAVCFAGASAKDNIFLYCKELLVGSSGGRKCEDSPWY